MFPLESYLQLLSVASVKWASSVVIYFDVKSFKKVELKLVGGGRWVYMFATTETVL